MIFDPTDINQHPDDGLADVNTNEDGFGALVWLGIALITGGLVVWWIVVNR